MSPGPRTERAEGARLGEPQDIVEQAALRWEVVLSVGRALFCLLILIRTLVTVLPDNGGLWRAGPEVPILLAIIAFSIWSVRRVRTNRATDNTLVASVIVDAIGCFLALLLNVLTPWTGYAGILLKPDVAALLVVMMAAGFRLSSRAATVACVLNGLAAAALVAIDLERNAAMVRFTPNDVLLFAMLLVTTMAIALVLSTRIRRLVFLAAEQRVTAERAKQNLFDILSSSHEMRSAISAVVLETDLFLRAASGEGALAERDDVVRVGNELRSGLDRLHALVASMRERTYAELATQQGATSVEIEPALDAVLARVRPAYPAVHFVKSLPEAEARVKGASGPRARLVGGQENLDRVLSNLIVNACEGDGRASCSEVAISVRGDGPHVTIAVRDDGPGFPAEVLSLGGLERNSTTKPRGSGLGLFLVHTMVTASGGVLSLRNLAEGGAEVTIQLLRDSGFS